MFIDIGEFIIIKEKRCKDKVSVKTNDDFNGVNLNFRCL